MYMLAPLDVINYIFVLHEALNGYIYILGVVALDETNISGCLHFSMQNIKLSCDLDRASRWSNFNVSQ